MKYLWLFNENFIWNSNFEIIYSMKMQLHIWIAQYKLMYIICKVFLQFWNIPFLYNFVLTYSFFTISRDNFQENSVVST